MALRGVRPSAEDIAAVEADPAELDAIVDVYLDSAEFGATMRELHNDALLVLTDYFLYPAGFRPVGPLDGEDYYALNRSVMEAPLRLIEHVIANDRPYSEIVTADYTLANHHVAAVWGLPYSGEGEWIETSWEDGRENAGILSDSWLYHRHSSTRSNANRGRANAISRALLCNDFATRDIELDVSIDLADPEVVANAVEANPTCAGCHQTLDPLASFFRGFFPLRVPGMVEATCDPLPPQYDSPDECEEYPLLGYYPDLFPDILRVPMRDPAFFGSAGDEVQSLGEHIAEDPRFALCAAERFYSFFHQVPLDDVPFEAAAELQTTLIESDMNAKTLTKAIVMSDEFRVSHVVPVKANQDTIEPEDDVIGFKKARPEQLARMIEDVTGYRWRADLSWVAGPDLPYGLGTVDVLEDSFVGYQVLAGGVDGIFTTRPSHTYSATSSLVLRALAEYAAEFVVESDFGGEPRKLLTIEETTTERAQIRTQLATLWLRLYSDRVAAENPELESALTLWDAAFEHSNSTRRAWKVTLAAMLQDVRLAYY